MFWFKKKQNIPKQEVRRLTQEEVNQWYGYQMELEKEYSKLYWEYEKLKGSYSKLTGFEYQEEFIKEFEQTDIFKKLKNDYSRILFVLGQIDFSKVNKEYKQIVEDIQYRIGNDIPKEHIELVRIQKIGKKRAEKLFLVRFSSLICCSFSSSFNENTL